MPIYEYQSVDPIKACPRCRRSFEAFQGVDETPLASCPSCGGKVRKIMSRCHAAVQEVTEEQARVEKKIKDYESSGLWSHAAELADKHSEKTKDRSLRMRALDNYRKAGYDQDTLARHADTTND